jgi:hypothetical protein
MVITGTDIHPEGNARVSKTEKTKKKIKIRRK